MERSPRVANQGAQGTSECRTIQVPGRTRTTRTCGQSGWRKPLGCRHCREFSTDYSASASAARQASGTVTRKGRDPPAGLGPPKADRARPKATHTHPLPQTPDLRRYTFPACGPEWAAPYGCLRLRFGSPTGPGNCGAACVPRGLPETAPPSHRTVGGSNGCSTFSDYQPSTRPAPRCGNWTAVVNQSGNCYLEPPRSGGRRRNDPRNEAGFPTGPSGRHKCRRRGACRRNGLRTRSATGRLPIGPARLEGIRCSKPGVRRKLRNAFPPLSVRWQSCVTPVIVCAKVAVARSQAPGSSRRTPNC